MLLVYICIILCFTDVIAQPNQQLSARELDSLLQAYAFRSLSVNPRTGIVYQGNVPSNLTGIQVSALRLRSGSLRRRGLISGYKEFHFPVGILEQPYVERLVLVYHNLNNWTSSYYPLPGHTFLTPVSGFLAYDAADLSATNLSELDIRASGEPISIGFTGLKSRSGLSPKCVYFRLDGSVVFDNVVRGNTCLTTEQGHFAIVAETLVAPAPAPEGSGGRSSAGSGGGKGRRRRRKWWIIGGSVIGGLVLVVLLVVVLVYVKKCRRRKKMRRMEEAAEVGVELPMTSVGNTKAPVALETRTRPSLEDEFVP